MLPAEGGAGPSVMLPPMVLARMIQALAIEAGDHVLDVGSGRGYAAAILSRLGADVVALESAWPDPSALHQVGGPGRVVTRAGPIEAGSPDDAPFDAVLINGAVEVRPIALIEQLREGGRLACLEMDGGACQARLYVRAGGSVSFRPLFDAGAPVLAPFRKEPAFTF
jgi:protein-L-isoaspartate(D-aspartate) O-methyltransferase